MPSFSWPIRVLVIAGLLLFDGFIVRHDFITTHHIPFSLPQSIEERVATLLPTPVPTPVPLEKYVEFSEGEWVGSVIYGKLTNKNTTTVTLPAIQFTVSKSKEGEDILKIYTATISAKLAPQESVYFSQRFTLPTSSAFWWSEQIIAVSDDAGSPLPKVPTGQKVSTKPIRPPVSTVPTQTDTSLWGVAKQIDDVTWTIKVGQDERMATPQETLEALNQYRKIHGVAPLTWDNTLAAFAQKRAAYLNSIQGTDKHQGFIDYVASEDNVKSLGFWSLGENSGYGNQLLGVHLIEWIYAADEGHNRNQLDSQWSHVGIGIQGLGVAFIFGGSK
ncbi:MAG: CAP domain-containing protein, partial [Candidatus Woesebacteria bacterium]